MNEFIYPKASLLPIECPRCKVQKPENGGYRLRKLRDVGGVREAKVMKVRCRNCRKLVACVYPPEVPRAKWYSTKLEGIFAILDVHQVDEGVGNEIAEQLGYPLKPETRANWQGLRAWRIERLENEAKQTLSETQIDIASLDEFKVTGGWVYSLTDVSSQAVLTYCFSEKRSESVVRDLIAEHEPKAIISDGCKAIKAACEWFANVPHGRCWFHVIRDVLNNFKKAERKPVAFVLRCLYEQDNLEEAEHFLNFLVQNHGTDKLNPLLNAWQGLAQIWLVPDMPLTNNTSENLYHGLWRRSRKRVVNAEHRLLDWLKEAFWRWNHHHIDDKSPWQRFSSQASPHWLNAILTPLGRSYDF